MACGNTSTWPGYKQLANELNTDVLQNKVKALLTNPAPSPDPSADAACWVDTLGKQSPSAPPSTPLTTSNVSVPATDKADDVPVVPSSTEVPKKRRRAPPKKPVSEPVADSTTDVPALPSEDPAPESAPKPKRPRPSRARKPAELTPEAVPSALPTPAHTETPHSVSAGAAAGGLGSTLLELVVNALAEAVAAKLRENPPRIT